MRVLCIYSHHNGWYKAVTTTHDDVVTTTHGDAVTTAHGDAVKITHGDALTTVATHRSSSSQSFSH